MIHTILDYRKLKRRPKRAVQRIPVYIIGAGFISRQGHGKGAAMSGSFRCVGAAPSRDEEKAAYWGLNLELAPRDVTNDYKTHLPAYIKKYRNLVVLISADTPNHKEIIIWCAENGVRAIVVDKPVAGDVSEFEECMAAIEANDVTFIVTFNHEFSPAMQQLRIETMAEVAEHGPDSVNLQAGFLQCWVKRGVDNWRLLKAGWAEGILDIWTHAASGAAMVLGSPIVRIDRAFLATSNAIHDYSIWDNGDGDVEFANGVKGQIRFHQCLQPWLDNYFVRVDFRRTGISKMFALDEHGEGLLVGPMSARSTEHADWPHLHQRGTVIDGKPVFDPKITDMYGVISPPGHGQAWCNFWEALYYAIAGHLWREQNHWIVPALPPIMHLPVPLVRTSGLHAQLAAAALEQSFKTGKPVDLADVAAPHKHVAAAYSALIAA